MPFWIFKEKEDDKAKREAQEASVKELERGNLPLGAQHRLKSQAASGSKFFSSNFSAKEYLLAREAGYEPIGQVMGSAFVQVGFRAFAFGYSQGTGEIAALTVSHRKARELAVSRLRQEAEILGAHGVIGVKIKTSTFSWGEGLTEFTAIGTAIRVPNPELIAASKNLPFTSTLSGQEFWQLYEAGFWPTGLVMGNCSYYAKGTQQTASAQQGIFGSQINQELVAFSEGFVTARKQATQRLWNEIGMSLGDGAVDMNIDYKLQRIEYTSGNRTIIDMLVHFMAMGTAITERSDAKARISKTPRMVIDLSGSGLSSVDFEDPLYSMGGYSSSFDDDDALD